MDSFYLIDLAFYQDQQFLFFDHAYFEINYLLLWRKDFSTSRWHALLDHLSMFNRQDGMVGLYGADVGDIELVRTMRQEVVGWVDRHESNRLSYMESQYLLARIAAGLNFANKRLSDEERRRAFLYAAFNLKDYLKLNTVDWPKHGSMFGLADNLQPAPAGLVSISDEEIRAIDETANPPLPDKPAIAVLAFENRSGDPSQEYFADGMTEEVITELSRVDWLMVIASTSTFSYKGKAIDVKEIGKQLGVHYVVQGSVRRSEDRVRISVQLTDADANQNIWAERYDRSLEDIFALQEEIASTITRHVDWELKTVERDRAQRKRTNLSAWDKFQQAMWHAHSFTDEGTETAKSLLKGTLELSPGFASCHAVLAVLECRKVFYGETDDPEANLKRALAHATKAVSLEEGNSLARLSLGRVYIHLGRFEEAIAECEAAIASNPSFAVAYYTLAGALMYNGRAADALPILEMSVRLSPHGPFEAAKLVAGGLCHYFLGDLAKAEKDARQAGRGRIVGPFGRLLLAATLARQGRLDEARQAAAEVQEIRSDMTLSRFHQAWSVMDKDYMEMLSEDLRKAGLPE